MTIVLSALAGVVVGLLLERVEKRLPSRPPVGAFFFCPLTALAAVARLAARDSLYATAFAALAVVHLWLIWQWRRHRPGRRPVTSEASR